MAFLNWRYQAKALIQLPFRGSERIISEKRRRIPESLSFRTAGKTDAGEAVAARTDGGKVRVARNPPRTQKSGKSCVHTVRWVFLGKHPSRLLIWVRVS